MNIGCHLSISKGFKHIYKTANDIGATTFQFFSRNPRGSSAKKLISADFELNKKLRSEYNINPLIAHLPYTVNAASPTNKVWNFASEVILNDLLRMDQLGVDYLVMHPGSYAKSSLLEGLNKIVKALELVFNEYQGKTILCLETMSGKGTEIGSDFVEFKYIFDSLGNTPQLGLCLDCCHLFAATYDFTKKQEVDRLINDIDKYIGLKKVYLSHLNDSKAPCGSKKDRHEKIYEGLIGKKGILNYVNHRALKDLPFILETPVDNVGEYKDEIDKLKEAIS